MYVLEQMLTLKEVLQINAIFYCVMNVYNVNIPVLAYYYYYLF